eukprot:gnl/Chilomastix_caulleri/3275.p2 GENE.gnl/Chilomastix_caulleri/3275~~gnl/Chilomastix_caulleri/3275.p2  ORF type:complete len:122 (+),score=37.48 gnl/Chilomastix_caulleri/3275:127-492(+)
MKYACLLGICDVLIRIVRKWDGRRCVSYIGGRNPGTSGDIVIGGVDKFFIHVARMFGLHGITTSKVKVDGTKAVGRGEKVEEAVTGENNGEEMESTEKETSVSTKLGCVSVQGRLNIDPQL